MRSCSFVEYVNLNWTHEGNLSGTRLERLIQVWLGAWRCRRTIRRPRMPMANTPAPMPIEVGGRVADETHWAAADISDSGFSGFLYAAGVGCCKTLRCSG